MKTTTKAAPITEVTRLYGRCLTLTIGAIVVEVKVMGDKGVAAAQRDTLLAALAEMGVPVKDDPK